MERFNVGRHFRFHFRFRDEEGLQRVEGERLESRE